MSSAEKTVTCSHCLLETNRNQAIVEEVNGKECYFCCPGCSSVYKLLQEEGFSKFYSKRDESWEPGAVVKSNVSEELFIDAVLETDTGYEVNLALSGIRCAACIWLIETYLSKAEGIESVRVNYATHKAKIRWTKGVITLREIIDRISSIGYCPLPISESGTATIYEKEKKDYFFRFSIGAFFSMQLMIYTVALYAGYFQGIDTGLRTMFQYAAWLLSTPVIFYSGLPFMRSSLAAIKRGHTTMDTLIFMGSSAAYIYSIFALFLDREVYFDTASMIITLILLGRYIEAGAKAKTSNAVSKLLTYQPTQVRYIADFDIDAYTSGRISSETVPVKQIRHGDILEVLPGDSIPADGIVLYGTSEVNESMLTGEPLPQTKGADAKVFAGTGNINGKLIIQVEHTGATTTLSRIVQAVEDAQSAKAPIQNVADKVVGWFVPTIITIGFLTFAGWYYYSSEVLTSTMNAVSVLVIACPCALGLATPLAILIATSKITKLGAVAKAGDIIEILSRANTIIFDKTGTITKGELKVENIVSTREDFLKITASLERHSSHLIAKAITGEYLDEFLPVENFKEHPGKGLSGSVSGLNVLAGTLSYLKENGVQTPDDEVMEHIKNGYTAACVSINGEFGGFMTLSDTIRKDAVEMLKQLSKRNVQTVILTGDNEQAAAKLVERLAIPNLTYIAEVTPFEKADVVKSFQKDGKVCAMVGDGINDAPALTTADVGIAIGKGTDIAIESSDIVLMRDELKLVATVYDTSVITLRVIKQNLFWAFSYNIVMVPLAVTGTIHPVFSAALMSVSSLAVVFNSLRINR
ncbi:MAG: heavy metal translocating P-type ATPase [Deferribacterales bacterium]